MDIPVNSVRELASKLYNLRQIAAHLGVSHDTLQRRLKEPEYAIAFEQGRELGCVKVLDKQLEVALEGSVPMLVHLGRHYLGQRDIVENQVTGADGKPLQIEIVRVVVDRTNHREIEDAQFPASPPSPLRPV